MIISHSLYSKGKRSTPTPGPDALKRKSAGSRLAQKLIDYTKPRPTTSGDLPSPTIAGAVFGGAVKGYITSGPAGAAAGLLGGYLGLRGGAKSGTFSGAILSGALTGAAVGGAMSAGLQLLGRSTTLNVLAAQVLSGGMAGIVGTLSGSRRAITRDSTYGGLITGAIAAAYTGNPTLMLATSAGSGIAARAATTQGRIVVGIISGATMGALSSILQSGQATATAALIGAMAAPIGTVLGPILRQVQRNAIEDLSRAAEKRLTPWLQRHPLGKKGKISAGATAGALTLGPLGLLFGTKGALAAAGLGAIVGAANTYHFITQREKDKQLQTVIERYSNKSYLLRNIQNSDPPVPSNLPLSDIQKAQSRSRSL